MAKTWTENELAAIDSVSANSGMEAYHAWAALVGYTKTYDAFEVKRRRVNASRHALAFTDASQYGVSESPDKHLVTLKDIANYVGFNVAYWDLETTFSTQPLVLYGAIADTFGNIRGFSKGHDITDDKILVQSIRDALNGYDIWVTWNGKLFDVPVLNGRLIFHGLEPLAPKMHIDLMYKATGGSVRIGRRSLQSVSEYFNVENRKTPLTVRVWDRAMAGDSDAYQLIGEHCRADCLVLRDVFAVLKPQIGTIQR